jgi:hypothetical protein
VQIVKPERRFSGLDSFGPRRRGFVARLGHAAMVALYFMYYNRNAEVA